MKLMFDTVNISDISGDMEVYPIIGVTSNPSIIKAEGKIDFLTISKKYGRLSALSARCMFRSCAPTMTE